MLSKARTYWNRLIGLTKDSTYAEAISSLKHVEESISKISTSIMNVDSSDFNVVKNTWVDLPEDMSYGVSVMGLHIGEDYTSLIGYYTPHAYVKPHQHKKEWEIVKILEGEAYDKANDIRLTKGDVYIIPKNKTHNIITLGKECYLYALFTTDKKFLKIPHTESDAAAKKYVNELKDISLKGVNVLYIDSNVDNLYDFKKFYHNQDFTTYIAKDLEEAKEILSKVKIHVLFCNYDIFQTTGTNVIKEIRAEYPGVVPIAILEKMNRTIITELREEAGVSTYIHMPINYHETIDTIKYAYNIHKRFGE